jgi:uncharacterized protein (TIGR03435 family)
VGIRPRGLSDFRASEWINVEERYDIVAKAEGPATNEQMKPMLQTLLTERFQMQVHRKKRELPVYVLLPGKSPAKVKIAAPGGEPRLAGSASSSFLSQPISRFTFMLTRRMGAPVLDMTGLTGIYDFTVDISGLGFNGNPSANPNPGPSIFTAVEENLGLKLEARKAPIDVLVIDHVEKVPTEN